MDTSLFYNSQSSEMEDEDKIRVTMLPESNSMIVLMNHPASITIYQHVSIEVLSGNVSVFGYEMSPKSLPIEVFSSEKTGLIEVKTESFECLWKKREEFSALQGKIKAHAKSKADEILTSITIGYSTVAILVRQRPYPANIRFFEACYPQALEFNQCRRDGKPYYHVKNPHRSIIKFGIEEEKMASYITRKILEAERVSKTAPRVLVYGPQNTGKTTLLRFLVNKLQPMHEAYYLDTDPGQTEFTPPGTVSLTKVTKPVIGPPFCHQWKPVKMMFTGSISPTTVEMYNKSVFRLVQLYDKNFANEPLFVNTMGWVQGLGLECLINTMSAVKPTILIEFVGKDETSMFDYRDYLSGDVDYFQICCSDEQRPSYFSSKEMRTLSLLSHFGKCQSEYFGPVPLNEIRPYSVPWDKIPLHIFPEGIVPEYRMFEAISESVVALCTVPKHAIEESKFPECPEYPKTLISNPDHNCLGYGLVRAADEKEHLLYIISPLKEDEWKKVNAIIKGHITVPDTVILSETVLDDVAIPFTDEREIIKTTEVKDDEDNEVMDVSMISLKSPGADSPATDLNAYASVDNYRKSIPKRYRSHTVRIK